MFPASILLVLCLIHSLQARLIDSDQSDPISRIADVVCQSAEDEQISRLSTIERLVDYLRSQNNQCREQYLESLEDLKRVIELDYSDVCNDRKIQAIEHFHRRYITTVGKHKKAKKAIPKPAKLLFMHYSTLISSRCEQAALQVLPEALKLLQDEKFEMEETLNSFADALSIRDAKLTYESVFLPWNLIENLPLEKSDKFARNIQIGPEKMFIEMRQPENIVRLQGICNYRLKPLYLNTLLPVIRLVDIGYYSESDALMKRLSTDARNLYLSAQFCETLLPVQVSRNELLAEDHVAIKPIAEAKKNPLRLVASGMEMQKVLKLRVPLNEWDIRTESAAAIKARVKSRGHVARRALLRLAKAIKSKLTSSKRQISISSEDKPIEGVNEAVDSAVANMEEDDSKTLTRKRRESTLRKVLMLPIKVIGVILYPLIYVLLELPYRWIYKRRLIPIRVMDTSEEQPFYWNSYSVNRKDRTEEWRAMMAERGNRS